MKKLITIILLISAGLVSAQETPPAGLKSINNQFYISLSDSSIWENKGLPYGWHRVAKYKEVATKIGASFLSAMSPLTYNSVTGVFSMPAASGSQNGHLLSTDWTTFNNKLSTAIAASTYLPINNPTATGTMTFPTPFTLGSTSVTTTGARLNYLTSAGGTTGTASSNLVFSTSPTLVTPVIGVATGTSLDLSAVAGLKNGIARVGSLSSAFSWFSSNGYWTGSVYTRTVTGFASMMQMYNGGIQLGSVNTGTGDFTKSLQFKTEHTGAFAFGSSIDEIVGSTTGAYLHGTTSGVTSTVPITVPDAVFSTAWNSDLTTPTKNAVFDKLELLRSARIIYVDTQSPAATDTRTGISQYSQFVPFKTISAAHMASVTADIVYVRPGTYTESVNVAVTTTAGSNVAPTFYLDGATVVGGVSYGFNFSGNSLGYLYLNNSVISNTGSSGSRTTTAAVVANPTYLQIHGNSKSTCRITSVEGHAVNLSAISTTSHTNYTATSTNGNAVYQTQTTVPNYFYNVVLTSTNANVVGGFASNMYFDNSTLSGTGGLPFENQEAIGSLTNSTLTATSGYAIFNTAQGGGSGTSLFNIYNSVISGYSGIIYHAFGGGSMAANFRVANSRFTVTNGAVTNAAFMPTYASQTTYSSWQFNNVVSNVKLFDAATRASTWGVNSIYEANTSITGSNLLANYIDVQTKDEAYNATTWDGSLNVPTKNAVRDKIETLGAPAASAVTNTPSGTIAATNVQTAINELGTEKVQLDPAVQQSGNINVSGNITTGSNLIATGNANITGTSSLGNTVTVVTAPTTSAGTYDLLTRNTSTGVVEKIASSGVGVPYTGATAQLNLGTNSIKSGAVFAGITDIGGNFTVAADMFTVRVSTAGGACTATLPDAGTNAGRILHIGKYAGGSNVTIQCAGSDVFAGGATSQTLTTIGEFITLQSNGQWVILNRYP